MKLKTVDYLEWHKHRRVKLNEPSNRLFVCRDTNRDIEVHVVMDPDDPAMEVINLAVYPPNERHTMKPVPAIYMIQEYDRKTLAELKELFEHIDAEHKISAKICLEQLKAKLGGNDPEITRASALMKFFDM